MAIVLLLPPVKSKPTWKSHDHQATVEDLSTIPDTSEYVCKQNPFMLPREIYVSSVLVITTIHTVKTKGSVFTKFGYLSCFIC